MFSINKKIKKIKSKHSILRTLVIRLFSSKIFNSKNTTLISWHQIELQLRYLSGVNEFKASVVRLLVYFFTPSDIKNTSAQEMTARCQRPRDCNCNSPQFSNLINALWQNGCLSNFHLQLVCNSSPIPHYGPIVNISAELRRTCLKLPPYSR